MSRLPVARLSPDHRERPYWLDGLAPVAGAAAESAAPPGGADVVVIGSGYTGVTTALELARRGREVVIVEEHTAGWGASTRNGGMVLPELKAGFEELVAEHGPTEAHALLQTAVDAVELVDRLVIRERIECGWRNSGHLYLAHRADRVPGLKSEISTWTDELGIDARFVERDELASEIGTPAYHGGLLVSRGGGIHPARYHHGLLRAALAAGARLCEGFKVTAVDRRGSHLTVSGTAMAATAAERSSGSAAGTTRPRSEITASEVVVATNAYTGRFLPELHRRIMPVGSFMIATEPIAPEQAREISPNDRMFYDTKNFLNYWRLSPDGTRVLFGGRTSFAPTTLARARNRLVATMVAIHPQLSTTSVTHSWGGQVALTRDRFPHFGRTSDGVRYALGYNGSGIAMGTLFGHRMAGWICGDDPPPFEGLAFPGLPVRRALPVTLPVAGAWFWLQDHRAGRS